MACLQGLASPGMQPQDIKSSQAPWLGLTLRWERVVDLLHPQLLFLRRGLVCLV